MSATIANNSKDPPVPQPCLKETSATPCLKAMSASAAPAAPAAAEPLGNNDSCLKEATAAAATPLGNDPPIANGHTPQQQKPEAVATTLNGNADSQESLKEVEEEEVPTPATNGSSTSNDPAPPPAVVVQLTPQQQQRLDDAVQELIASMQDVRGQDTHWVEQQLQQVRTPVFNTVHRRAKFDRLRPELQEKILAWLVSFHHLDPRYKILTFFNQVASDGADHFVNEEDSDPHLHYDVKRQFTRMEELILKAFDTTSILTVWRPTSNEAMRKMMCGTGVGKGLDIKGKSAKKGDLSAYVPFLQIHVHAHKEAIAPIDPKSQLRVYYSSPEAREVARQRLLHPTAAPVVDESTTCTGNDEMDILHGIIHEEGDDERIQEHNNNPDKTKQDPPGDDRTDNNEDEDPTEQSIDVLDNNNDNHNNNHNNNHDNNNHNDNTHRMNNFRASDSSSKNNETSEQQVEIKFLDQYAKQGYYGMEVSQQVFWNAYVTHQNIERQEDTVTGRPSMPGFQDANLKTLKLATAAPAFQYAKAPRPVVFQYHDTNPMSPQHLLMAYEEQGTVTPVVSDFDGFIMGWRREALWFGCNLPRDQEDLMIWCMDQIEGILDDGASSESWTSRWLQVLERDNPNPDVPKYGFGDPKSYGIMERAAWQLIDTGAVRHGSECFNYHFPQEMDDHFLLITDTLEPVPWKYVNVQELQSILLQRIQDGFVFPINPKWILCDPGWKEVYDKLMESNALYAEYSKDVWYPPKSGIRESIERISKKHPKGFQRQPRPPSPVRRPDHQLRQGICMRGPLSPELSELQLAALTDEEDEALLMDETEGFLDETEGTYTFREEDRFFAL